MKDFWDNGASNVSDKEMRRAGSPRLDMITE